MAYRIKRGATSKRLSKTKSEEMEDLTTLNLPALRRKRTVAINRVSRILQVAQTALSDRLQVDVFLAHYSAFKKFVDTFEEAHFDILSSIDSSSEDQEDIIRSHFDDICFQIIAIHQRLIGKPKTNDDVTKSNESLNNTNSLRVKLPKIEIPKFSGNIKSWPEFYDLFNSLIHSNGSLTDSDRMHYLISSLSGDAAALIRTFPREGKYYEDAYTTLIARYRDKRELAFTCWREIQNINLKINLPHEFRRALDLFHENITILKGLNLPVDQWDFVLSYLLLSKLDPNTRSAFEHTQSSTELPSFKGLSDFLYSKSEALIRNTYFSTQPRNDNEKSRQSSVTNNKKPASVLLTNSEKKPQSKTNNTKSSTSQPPLTTEFIVKCSFCSQTHSISHCKDFLQKSVQERFNHAKTNNWCINCLKPSHNIKDCRSIFKCQLCKQRHHTLLHLNDADSPQDPIPNQDGQDQSLHVMTNVGDSSIVLLSTAIIHIRDVSGHFQTLRALIDSGSQAHFITDRAADRLGLNRSQSTQQIRGLGQSSASVSGVVRLEVGINGKVVFNINALTLPTICGNMPSTRLNKSSWQHIQKLKLADPDCHKPGPVDVLIGAEIFSSLLLAGAISGQTHEPSALNSVFGWILLGNVGCNSSTINSLFVSNDCQLHEEVAKIWELDIIPQTSPLTPEEQRCEKRYVDTYSRDQSGRYIVTLPFKEDDTNRSFPGSREIALRRFHSLERKLSGNQVLTEQYSEFMSEYYQSGHMSLVPVEDLRKGKNYISHHCVLRPDSATSKIRVVFDASAKDITGKSLNETLLIGPKMQTSILEILLRFRIHPIVYTADVRQMYRQILVDNKDRDYQRIFWRSDSSQPMQEYRLNTVTYGVSSAPFLACRTVQQLAIDEGCNLPLARKVLASDVYIDNIVTGCSDLEQARQSKSEVIELFKRGQMELRKWASNEPALLADLPAEHRLSDNVPMDVEKSNTLKVLGLKWDPLKDCFLFEVNPQERKCTKRNILSEVARIFDPLGFLSPVTLLAKSLVQQLWILEIPWDDDPPTEISRQWEQYLDQLPAIKGFQLPRCLSRSQIQSCQIHGFADSSEAGYGAVVYLRIVDDNGDIQVVFICAKSRVAPTKKVSLPRLELCAAVLLSDLIVFVKEVFSPLLPISCVIAWSDSTVALAWIRSPSHRWKTFVANRVSHIQENLPNALWLHVASADNPADIASRGQSPADLVQNSLWWAGPSWLSLPELSWQLPMDDSCEGQDIGVDTEKRSTVLLTSDTPEVPSHPVDFNK